jgi:hypothetical protein
MDAPVGAYLTGNVFKQYPTKKLTKLPSLRGRRYSPIAA